jgi:hypothetical protein
MIVAGKYSEEEIEFNWVIINMPKYAEIRQRDMRVSTNMHAIRDSRQFGRLDTTFLLQASLLHTLWNGL